MKNLKRVLSMLMCIVMLLGMLPVEAFAVTTDENGTTVYEIGDSVWVRGEEAEPTGVCVPDTFWLPDYDENDQPVTRVGLCEKTEHTHSFVCPENCDLAHQHEEGCYTQGYTGCVIHTHDETCTTATVYGCGKEQHENHDACTASEVCTLEEHDHAALTCPTEVRFTCETQEHTHSEEAGCAYETVFTCAEEHEHSTENGCAQETRCVCTEPEHTHSVEAGCATETVYTCGKDNHAHSEDCTLTTVYDCGKEIHTHEEACNATQTYPDCVEHTEHNETCTTEQQLTCGKDEHTCTTEGCAADCATEAHTHTEECDMEGVYYKWTVVEDTSSTLENDRGLPIHFFIAEPGQAIDPDGSYVNYRQSHWGSNNDSDYSGAYANITQAEITAGGEFAQIATKNGIRNVSDESTVTQYIYKLPDAYNTMTALKNFGSITIDRVTYSESEYEIKWVTICYRSPGTNGLGCYCGVRYNHIHIDGVLSKKVTPAEMKLTKKILTNHDTAETFNFTLTKLQHDSNGDPTDNVDTSFGTNGSITLTSSIPAGDTTASIVSPTGQEIGFGYYKLEEVANDRWQTSAIEITRNNANSLRYSAGPVYILIATDGTLRYSSTLDGTYATATNITIENERKPLTVTYSWEGVPNGLATLPESSTVAPGGTHAINTSWPIGARVRGQEDVKDPETGLSSERYYYEFVGWQYYDPEIGDRQYITYTNGAMSPSTITDIQTDINVHGLWTRHDLATADGYITITKTFANKPAGENFDNFYIAVIHDDHETDISPNLVGSWNADGTQWTYDFAISESGTYKIVEGKYDLAGYQVTPTSAFTPVAGISTGAAYTGADFVSDGHVYTELGQEITVTLPYDTSAVSGVAGQADNSGFYAGTVAFTNTYTKKTSTATPEYPDFRVRKWDSNFYNTLTGAAYALTKDETSYTAEVVGDTSIYRDLQPGTYTLKETNAPEGYIADATEYTVNVVLAGETEELRAVNCSTEENHTHTTACYEFVTVQTYTVEVPDADGTTLPGVFNPDPEVLRLNLPNEQIRADLNISKTFVAGDAEFTPTAGSVLVDIYGPVVRDGSTITDVGSLIHTGLAITLDANNKWNLTVEDLPYGEYFIEETMGSVHGYTWKGVGYSQSGTLTPVTVDGHTGVPIQISSTTDVSLNITNTYEVWKSADFYILKEDLSGNELAGAKFELYDADNKQVQTGTTDINGLVHFTGFAPAAGETLTYTLKETQAPEGYYLTTREYKVIVTHDDAGYDIQIRNADGTETGDWDHNDDLLTVINTPILGQITVNKTLAGDAVPEGTSVTFTLQSADGSLRRTATITSEDKWTHTFGDLPLGTYTLTETFAEVPGYKHTTEYQVGTDAKDTGITATVTLEDDSNHTLTTGTPTGAQTDVEFINTYDRQEMVTVNADSLTVFKRDENGDDLAGATFTLFADETCKTQLTGVSFATTATSDAYGQARFTNLKLESGNELVFYMKETKAPAGYVLSDTVWKIKLDDTVHVEVLNDQNVFETVIDWITSLWKPKDGTTEYEWVAVDTLAVTNQRIKGTLTINKSFSSNVPASALTNARVEVHVHGPIKRENGQITDIGPLVENINLTGGDWEHVVSNLEVGEYVVREPFASIHGYSWDTVTYSGTYSDPAGTDGKSGISTVTFDGNQFALFKVSDQVNQPVISLSLANTYTVWEAADFYVNKVKSLNSLNDGLAGAKFKLYNDLACTDPAVSSTENPFTVEGVTGDGGYIEFEGFTVASGSTKTFYLKEETAPDNYKLVDTVWEVTISHDSDGYHVKITQPGTDVTAVENKWNWNPLNDTLNVVNEEIRGSITITKDFVNAPAEGVSSVFVHVSGPNNYSETVELKENSDSTKNWTETIPNLPMGTYYIEELPATVAGYTLTTTYYEKEDENWVVEGETNNPTGYALVVLDDVNKLAPAVSVKIENKYKKETDLTVTPASFTVKKVDAENTAKLLDGAKFRLYSVDGNETETIAEATTVNGIATFSNLKMPDLDYAAYTNQGRKVTYYLAETQAPDGYIKSDVIWKVELSENFVKFDVLNEDENVFEIIVNWVAGLFKPNDAGSAEPYTKVTGTELTVGNQRIKGDLTVSKTFKDNADNTLSASALTNARVEIHVHGPITRNAENKITDIGPLVKNINLTDGDWNDEISNLEIGEYVIREPFASIHGYTWKDVVYSVGGTAITKENVVDMAADVLFAAFTVDAETPDIAIDVTNTYEVWKSADFYVNKVKSLDNLNDGLAGATFKLYKLENNQYVPVAANDQYTTEATTGLAGYAHFTGFNQAGTYYLMETSAPENYKKVNTVWQVKIEAVTQGETTSYVPKITLIDSDVTSVANEWIWNANNDTLNVVNQPITATLTIVKEFEGDALPADAFTSGDSKIQVKVTGPNGYDETKVLTLNREGRLSVTLENLTLGQYTVTEDTAHAKVPGYNLIATSYKVGNQDTATVTFDGTTETPSAEMVITNTYDKREAVVNNPDQFVIHKTDETGRSLPGAKFRLTNDHDPTYARDFVTGVDGKVIVGNLIGAGELNSYADVTYTLEEIEAPVGHQLSENRTWTIKVVKHEDSVGISVEPNEENDTYETIWDWVIDLFDPDEDYKNNVLTVVNNRKTTQIAVKKVVSGLPASSNETYIKNLLDAEYKFELYIDGEKQDEVVTVKAGETGEFPAKVPFGSAYEVKEVLPENPAFAVTMPANAKGTVDEAALNGIEVEVTNTYSIVDGSDLVLDIIKVSSGRTATPLSGAKFELYNSADTLMKSYTSGKDGKFQITEIVEPGTYELLETAAPSGYYKLYSPITITATYDYQVTKDVNNNPVIVKTLVATVAGSTSYQVDDNNDHYYGIKNTPVTEVAKTSDETDLLFWGGMTTFSLLCMAIMLLIPKKKGKYQR